MNREELKNKLKKIVADLWGIEEFIINDSSNFINDLQADSLDGVELIMLIENKFDIHITDEEAEKTVNFKLLVDLVESKVEE